MDKKKHFRRLLYFTIAGICLVLVLTFIGIELYGNYAAAQWKAIGMPDLREPTHDLFWARLLFTLGIGFTSLGQAIQITDEKQSVVKKNASESV